jgi:hypothetical protein
MDTQDCQWHSRKRLKGEIDMRKTVMFSLALVTGCQSVSEVVPAGNGTYMVDSEVRGGFSSWAEVRALTLTRANEYCFGQGKEMVQIDSKTRGARGWTPQEVELTFKCVESGKQGAPAAARS